MTSRRSRPLTGCAIRLGASIRFRFSVCVPQQEILAESLTDGSPLEDGFESGAELGFVREGLSRQALRKLRRGHWVVQGELDLHGLTVPAAREALVLFLQRCLRAGWRCVRIIHGRGLRSKNGEPVLRSKTAVLAEPETGDPRLLPSAPDRWWRGAVLVLLKGRKG